MMKRQHHQQQKEETCGSGNRSSGAAAAGKGKEVVIYEKSQGMGVDKELADAGYSVKSSDLKQVAQRLEQLEMVMCSAQEDGISHLSSETVHYNPSDLAGWIESMLMELNAPPDLTPPPRPDDQSHLPTDSTAPESSSTTSRGARTEQKADQYLVGLYESEVTHGLDESAVFLQDDYAVQYPDDGDGNFMDHMAGLFSQPSADPPISSDSSLEVQSCHYVRQQAEEGRRDKKRARSEPDGDASAVVEDDGSLLATPATPVLGGQKPMVMGADPQECGVRLVHTLMGCAEAVHQSNVQLAGNMVKQIRILASNQGGAMGKVATFFAEALARRIYGFLPHDTLLAQNDPLSDVLHMHFYETCPYLKFAHFTANQAILEAFSGHKRVHVIDFDLKQGMQWPALIQALALRPGGPPAFRLTGIGPPQADGTDALQEVGLKLALLAESINVEFDFRSCAASNLAHLQSWMLDVKPGVEAVAVNSILQFHRLLHVEPPGRPGGCRQPSAAIDRVLASVRNLNPKIVTMVEQEADHNRPDFLDRFTEALHYYSTVFDSIEACTLPSQSQEQLMSEIYLGREICNIVACEGPDRIERHETLMQWRVRMYNAGFQAMHLGSNAFKQASMLLSLFSGGEGYKVEENNGCLTLGWHSRPLFAVSAWQCC